MYWPACKGLMWGGGHAHMHTRLSAPAGGVLCLNSCVGTGVSGVCASGALLLTVTGAVCGVASLAPALSTA